MTAYDTTKESMSDIERETNQTSINENESFVNNNICFPPVANVKEIESLCPQLIELIISSREQKELNVWSKGSELIKFVGSRHYRPLKADFIVS